MSLIFRVPGSRFHYAQILKSRSYIIRFKSEIPTGNNNFSEIITSESLVGLRLMGSRRKDEKVGYDVGIEDSGDCIRNGAKQSDISASNDVHHISIYATSNFVSFYSPWMSLMLP
jgi:hypothetical protein